MTLQGIKAGDIIEADVRGRIFYAVVVEKDGRELKVTPVDPRINYYTVRAREVVGHWRKSKRA